MDLSIVILCWNNLGVLPACLRSIYAETRDLEFEVIIADNGSTDGTLAFVRANYPQVRIVENGANLGFSRGNNAAIPAARGAYILILNSDTIILDRALDKWIAYVQRYPEPAVHGCRVLNADGSFQHSARPMPTVWRYLVSALYLRPLGHLSDVFLSDTYVGWNGTTERQVDWGLGCCLLLPAHVLRELGGFDEQFFYYFEDTDLCLRAGNAGYPTRFYPGAEIVHLGGESTTKRFPIRFQLESYRNRYRFFFKHYGEKGVRRVRWISLLDLHLRHFGYGLWNRLRPCAAIGERRRMYRILIDWNRRVEPMRFIETGEEPAVDCAALTPGSGAP